MEKGDADHVAEESQNCESEIGSQRMQPKPKLNYDDILDHIGQLGRYFNGSYLHSQIIFTITCLISNINVTSN